MGFSILPIYLLGKFLFFFYIIRRTCSASAITYVEMRSIYFLLSAFALWTSVSAFMGYRKIHESPQLMEAIPLLWQANVPVVILVIALFLSKNLRNGLRAIAIHTPWHWFVFFEALRIGALGGVMKGFAGEITSDYVFWVGIPDFFYGVSAILIGVLLLRNKISHRALFIWNLMGPAIILLPTFIFMSYFMSDPGFVFIFEFPMVLAPSIVVPLFLFVNFLLAWRLYELNKQEKRLVAN